LRPIEVRNRRAERIVAGARGDADADPVGLEFLRPRESRQRQLGARQRHGAVLRIAQHVVDDVVHQLGTARLLFAHVGMARDHMRHLVGHHRGELG
jgi:hypothetical protein